MALTPQLTLNLGVRYELPFPFIDKNDAISSFRTGVQSQGSIRTHRPGWSIPATPACRERHRADRQEQTSRRAWRWRGIRSVTARRVVRSAFGVFYDALAGQGDFFQSGVLSPPFTPLVELNTPTPISLADPLAAVAGPPNPFPPALDDHRLGRRLQVAVRVSHEHRACSGRCGARIGTEVA